MLCATLCTGKLRAFISLRKLFVNGSFLVCFFITLFIYVLLRVNIAGCNIRGIYWYLYYVFYVCLLHASYIWITRVTFWFRIAFVGLSHITHPYFYKHLKMRSLTKLYNLHYGHRGYPSKKAFVRIKNILLNRIRFFTACLLLDCLSFLSRFQLLFVVGCCHLVGALSFLVVLLFPPMKRTNL